jgi:hypothetical protein
MAAVMRTCFECGVGMARGKVRLQQRADVGGQDAVKEDSQLVADAERVRNKRNQRGGNNQRGKEADDGGVGRGLRDVETVMVDRMDTGAAKMRKQSQHGRG